VFRCACDRWVQGLGRCGCCMNIVLEAFVREIRAGVGLVDGIWIGERGGGGEMQGR
jgi:hypothetical protein